MEQALALHQKYPVILIHDHEPLEDDDRKNEDGASTAKVMLAAIDMVMGGRCAATLSRSMVGRRMGKKPRHVLDVHPGTFRSVDVGAHNLGTLGVLTQDKIGVIRAAGRQAAGSIQRLQSLYPTGHALATTQLGI